GYFHIAVQFLLNAGTIFLLYYAFSRRSRLLHLLAGALVGAGLWFVMRPLFHLFLAYNPGFGFAFGSFKSLFVVLIWIYYSLAVFLFGAEIAANLGRKETIFLRKLMEGKGGIPASFKGKYLVRYGKGGTIFHEGDAGEEMYAVRAGSVGILKDDIQIAVIPQGKCFGEMSFLLASPRVATAVALEDVELVIINSDNVKNLMNEYPAFVVEMLREMALRLRETNKLVD
ncbi:MAG TPA: YhjD/YihY/BrkB family envelope integrity protein, partial [Nitrospirota bacterium]|nr:YhjD/YihY/BrkB family envelope integrity protein [Nitrospirota bacterium]